MSILIKGMKMPSTGENLSIYICHDGEVYIENELGLYERASRAVAKEIKPHGRLIDADALTDSIQRVDWYHQNEEKDMVLGANSAEHQAWYKEQDVYRAIEGASTIIEAEGVE